MAFRRALSFLVLLTACSTGERRDETKTFHVEPGCIGSDQTGVPATVGEGDPLVLDLSVGTGPMDEVDHVEVAIKRSADSPLESERALPGLVEVNAYVRGYDGIQPAVLVERCLRKEIAGLARGPYVLRFNTVYDSTRAVTDDSFERPHEPWEHVEIGPRRHTEVWQTTVHVIPRDE